MYHFVGKDEKLKGINLTNFKNQLDYLQKKYKGNQVDLTFDHGTIDHIETVAPELEQRGCRGIFFILTMVPEENRVPWIDKQRFLEANYRYELAKMLCTELYINYNPNEAEEHLLEYTFYSLEERYLRYLRDKVIPEKVYVSVIGNMFYKAFGDEKRFCLKHYLSWHHIYQLHQRGHIIGSHSHCHNGDIDDWAKSFDLLENVLDERPRFISYPNGVKKISDSDLENLGVDKAYISSEEGQYPYKTERIDCNQLKF